MWITAQWLATLQRMSTYEEQPHVGTMHRKECEPIAHAPYAGRGIEQYYCSAHFHLGPDNALIEVISSENFNV